MTPTALADALRNVEIANEETNYAKFQSDAAIVEEAAMMIEKQSAIIASYNIAWTTRKEKNP